LFGDADVVVRAAARFLVATAALFCCAFLVETDSNRWTAPTTIGGGVAHAFAVGHLARGARKSYRPASCSRWSSWSSTTTASRTSLWTASTADGFPEQPSVIPVTANETAVAAAAAAAAVAFEAPESDGDVTLPLLGALARASDAVAAASDEANAEQAYVRTGKLYRFLQALPGSRRTDAASVGRQHEVDDIDRTILSTAIPSMINNAVVPIVNSVDTFWVGRMGIALALAGQAAANQAFFTLYFLVNYLPTITAPLVASSVGSGDMDEAKQRVCQSLFLGNLFGGLVTIFLVGFPRTALSLVLPMGAPAMVSTQRYDLSDGETSFATNVNRHSLARSFIVCSTDLLLI